MRAARWLVGLTLTLLAPTAEVWACACQAPGPSCQNAFGSATEPAAASEDLELFQSLSAPQADLARVSGTIEHLELDLATRRLVTSEKMVGLRVTAKGAGGVVEALTDADSCYELNVPAGNYDVSVVPPSGFSTRSLERAV